MNRKGAGAVFGALCGLTALTAMSAEIFYDFAINTKSPIHMSKLNNLIQKMASKSDGEDSSAKYSGLTGTPEIREWYDEHGETMSPERWTNPAHRTLQYDAESTPENEAPNRILLVVHGNERPIDVTLPRLDRVAGYTSLWSSVPERPDDERPVYAPGDAIALPDTALHLFRME